MKLPALREIVEERKGKAIENLSESFARNKLPLEEYERLVEYINKIESERELVVVERIVSEYGSAYSSGSGASPSAASDDEDEPDYYHRDEDYSHSGGNLTLLSSRAFSGPVKSGAQFFAILGSEHIKIRKSDLQKRRTVLNIVTIMGETTISVESGIRVTNNTVPLLGGAWVNQKVNKQAEYGGPEIVISGAALLGSITVKLLKE